MQLGVLIRSYHVTDYLKAVLKSYDWVDKIVLLNYRFKTAEPRPDDTEQLALSMNLPNLIFKKGDSLEQHEIFNLGLELLKDCDYVFINDADEIILPREQKKIIENLHSNNRDIAKCPMLDYIVDFYHSFFQQPRFVLTVIKPSKCRFVKIREIENYEPQKIDYFPDCYIYHFGFIVPVAKLDWKIKWESIEEGVDVKNNLKNAVYYPCKTVPQEVLDFIGAA